MPRPTKSVTPVPLPGRQDWRQDKPNDKRFIDIEGQTFGDWSVLGYAGKRRDVCLWWCLCTACGLEKSVCGKALRKGKTSSCGCRRHPSHTRVYHGLSNCPGYSTWRTMIARCDRPTYPGWRWYGGRGIQVCPRWRDRETGLINFLADMGPRPEGTSIERRDNSGNYEPGNCYWATSAEQARNKRTTHTESYQGETLPLVDLAAKFGLRPNVVGSRLDLGWSLEKALTTPIAESITITHDGRTQTYCAWAGETGLSESVLRGRIRIGWSPQKTLETPMKGAMV